MKITVTRTWEPVTKTIERCQDCPWYAEEPDMNSTLPICQHPKFNGGKGGYDAVIGDIGRWNGPAVISKHCPLVS